MLIVFFSFLGILFFFLVMGTILAKEGEFSWETKFDLFGYGVLLHFSKANPLILSVKKGPR